MTVEDHPLFKEWSKAFDDYVRAVKTRDHLRMNKAPEPLLQAADRKIEDLQTIYDDVSSRL
jgi:hypothetical protein